MGQEKRRAADIPKRLLLTLAKTTIEITSSLSVLPRPPPLLLVRLEGVTYLSPSHPIQFTRYHKCSCSKYKRPQAPPCPLLPPVFFRVRLTTRRRRKCGGLIRPLLAELKRFFDGIGRRDWKRPWQKEWPGWRASTTSASSEQKFPGRIHGLCCTYVLLLRTRVGQWFARSNPLYRCEE